MPEAKERLVWDRWRGLERPPKDPRRWGSILRPDCDNLSIQAVTLYHGSVKWYHQEKLGTDIQVTDLFVLFLTTTQKSTIVSKSKFHFQNSESLK